MPFATLSATIRARPPAVKGTAGSVDKGAALQLMYCAAFLELSEDDAVDPDAAVEAMENFGVYLARMPEERVADLRDALLRISQHGRRAGYPPDLIEFLDGFVENFGLTEPE